MNAKKNLVILALLSIAALSCPITRAETSPPTPPPTSIAEDPGMEPEVTIRNRGGDRYEEYRINGQLYMIKITPKIGKPYYLVARDKDGGFERHNDLDKGFVPPRWVLFQW